MPRKSSRRCAGCGRADSSSNPLVPGPDGIPLCPKCVEVMFSVFSATEELAAARGERNDRDDPFPIELPRRRGAAAVPPDPEREAQEEIRRLKVPTPREIKAGLDEYVIGQDAAKKALAVAVHNHYRRVKEFVKNPQADDGVELEKSNILLLGPTGSGKTYFSNALALSALRKFKSVRYLKASTLIHELEAAEAQGEYLKYLNATASLDLLIIDDFGLMELDIDKCRNLFEVIDAREIKASTVMISQFPIASWYEMFQNNTYADACMDRLIHKAYRLEVNGKNMRNPDRK